MFNKKGRKGLPQKNNEKNIKNDEEIQIKVRQRFDMKSKRKSRFTIK